MMGWMKAFESIRIPLHLNQWRALITTSFYQGWRLHSCKETISPDSPRVPTNPKLIKKKMSWYCFSNACSRTTTRINRTSDLFHTDNSNRFISGKKKRVCLCTVQDLQIRLVKIRYEAWDRSCLLKRTDRWKSKTEEENERSTERRDSEWSPWELKYSCQFPVAGRQQCWQCQLTANFPWPAPIHSVL